MFDYLVENMVKFRGHFLSESKSRQPRGPITGKSESEKSNFMAVPSSPKIPSWAGPPEDNLFELEGIERNGQQTRPLSIKLNGRLAFQHQYLSLLEIR